MEYIRDQWHILEMSMKKREQWKSYNDKISSYYVEDTRSFKIICLAFNFNPNKQINRSFAKFILAS